MRTRTIELEEEELEFLRYLVMSVTLEVANPDLLKVATICESLKKKLGEPDEQRPNI